MLLFLAPLSIAYRATVEIRNILYNTILSPKRLPCPVISIGNLTVGGTGKTPLAITLAQTYRGKNKRPVILTRGYGRKRESGLNVIYGGADKNLNPEILGDEPALMARRLRDIPIIVCLNRHLAGQRAIELFQVDYIILDDAFQHRKLHRNVNILLIDKRRGFGNGWILPAGPLREPLKAIKRADILILTGEEDASEGSIPPCIQEVLERFALQEIPIFHGSRYPIDLVSYSTGNTYPLDILKGKKVSAFTGIAVPQSFRKTLETLGCELVSFLVFPDHHRYEPNDITFIQNTLKEKPPDYVITTEKDEVKLHGFPEFCERVLTLRIGMKVLPSIGELISEIDRLKGR
ncbi:MAG: tetraacyldisaccharide 4'-kinase [Syntrophales bacterium]|nr:tetraacyldisaccharide 4'-kinase [Syntrophales bacterium]